MQVLTEPTGAVTPIPSLVQRRLEALRELSQFDLQPHPDCAPGLRESIETLKLRTVSFERYGDRAEEARVLLAEAIVRLEAILAKCEEGAAR
jgi:hypothetical protein